VLDDGKLQDDPYLDTENSVLWWSSNSSGTTYIWETPHTDTSAGTGAIKHDELGTTTNGAESLEPALAPGALAIYYSRDGLHIWTATRKHTTDKFGAPTMLACGDPVESPSIGRDGMEIYLTDNFYVPAQIVQAKVDGPTIDTISKFAFEQTTVRYQDPSISPDGQTLVFASNSSGTNQLYYITRVCP
jgi:hypothetical protein